MSQKQLQKNISENDFRTFRKQLEELEIIKNLVKSVLTWIQNKRRISLQTTQEGRPEQASACTGKACLSQYTTFGNHDSISM